MKPLTINIDMDGVIYRMMDQLVDIAQRPNVRAFLKEEGYALPDDLHAEVGVWEIWEAWGIPKKAFWKLFYLAVDEGLFAQGEAMKDSVEVIGRFLKNGHRVRIVTSKMLSGRNESLKAQSDVLYWLHTNTPWSNRVEIVFAHNKQGYPADVVIDDKPTLAWAQKDAVNILFDQKWNEWVDAPGVGCWPLANKTHNVDRLYRAISWKEVDYLVERAAT